MCDLGALFFLALWAAPWLSSMFGGVFDKEILFLLICFLYVRRGSLRYLSIRLIRGFYMIFRFVQRLQSIYHLLFAYDNLLFGFASSNECGHIHLVLLDYELASRQKVNFFQK